MDLRVDHLYPWYRALATLPGAVWLEEGGFTAVHTGSAFAGFNAVLHAQGPAAVERAMACMAEGAWTRWSPGQSPDALDLRLVERGYRADLLTVMALDLDAARLDPRPAPTFCARTVADLEASADLIIDTFAIDPAHRAELRRIHVHLGSGHTPPWTVFGARVFGVLAAVGILAHDGEAASIHGIATCAGGRQRGLARAVTDAALRHARALGVRTMVVSTTPGGRVVAERLGFVEVGALRQLARG